MIAMFCNLVKDTPIIFKFSSHSHYLKSRTNVGSRIVINKTSIHALIEMVRLDFVVYFMYVLMVRWLLALNVMRLVIYDIYIYVR
jgi:hypothetical protein